MCVDFYFSETWALIYACAREEKIEGVRSLMVMNNYLCFVRLVVNIYTMVYPQTI